MRDLLASFISGLIVIAFVLFTMIDMYENITYSEIEVVLENSKDTIVVKNVKEDTNSYLILKDSSRIKKDKIVWIKKVK